MNPIPSKSPTYAKLKIALLILIAFLFILTPSSWAETDIQKANNLSDKGLELSGKGEYFQAILYWKEALALYQKAKSDKQSAYILFNLGSASQNLAQFDISIGYYKQALMLFRKFDMKEHEARTLLGIGLAFEDKGELSEAVKNMEYSICVFQDLKLYKEMSDVQRMQADILLSLGKPQDIKFINAKAKTIDPFLWGRYYLLLKQPKEAMGYFNMAQLSYHIAALPIQLIGLGIASEMLNDNKNAFDYFNWSVELNEENWIKSSMSEKYHFFSEVMFMGFSRAEAYEGLSRICAHTDKYEIAFEWSEHTKTRIFLELLARSNKYSHYYIPESIRQQETNIVNDIIKIKNKGEEIVDVKPPKSSGPGLHIYISGKMKRKDIPGLEHEISKPLNELKTKRSKLIETLRRDYPEYAAIQYPQPYKVNELALKPNEVLIEYEVTDPLTMVFVVKAGKVEKVIEVPLTRDELEKQIKAYRQPFEKVGKTGTSSSFSELDVELGHNLYKLLLEKALADVKPNEKVLIVPDEMLCLLPFEALVEELPAGKINWKDDGQGPYPEGVKFVGANRVFTYWQSASSMTVVRTLKKAVSGDKLLVVADPVYNAQDARLNQQQQSLIAKANTETDFQLKLRREVSDDAASFVGLKYFPRLEITSEFAQNLQTLYQGQVSTLMGFDATETKVKKQLSNPYGKAVIFATHGILDERVPYYQQAALVLADPQIAGEQINKNDLSSNNDGFLTMAEIMDLKIPTEIVATLACETGVGTMVGGEGVMNLGRAFQYAGARSVLISLWSVGDESTNLFGERFFTGLKNGESKDAALLATRQKLISLGYAHPFYWAPFILVGERDLSIKQ